MRFERARRPGVPESAERFEETEGLRPLNPYRGRFGLLDEGVCRRTSLSTLYINYNARLPGVKGFGEDSWTW
jgi:hypothetical protein